MASAPIEANCKDIVNETVGRERTTSVASTNANAYEEEAYEFRDGLYRLGLGSKLWTRRRFASERPRGGAKEAV